MAFGTGFALLLKITFFPEAVSTRRGAIDSIDAAKSGSIFNCGSSSSGGGVWNTGDFGREAMIRSVYSTII